jgi:four helix bundle protein
MPATPTYKTMDIYNLSKKLVVACYELTQGLPSDERSNLGRYIRTAALTVHVNIAQGAWGRKRAGKRKYIRAAQNALVVIDAAIDVLVEVGFAREEQTTELIDLSSACYQLLNGLKKEK